MIRAQEVLAGSMIPEGREKRPVRVVVAVLATLVASVSPALVFSIPGYRSLFRELPDIAWWIENALRPLIPVGLGLFFVYGARPARWARELGMNRPIAKALLLALLITSPLFVALLLVSMALGVAAILLRHRLPFFGELAQMRGAHSIESRTRPILGRLDSR